MVSRQLLQEVGALSISATTETPKYPHTPQRNDKSHTKPQENV